MIVFTYKNTESSDSKWIALHNEVFYYLYDGKTTTLVQYCQAFDKRKEFECIDVYDALSKVYSLTNETPVFRTSNDTYVPNNYLA